jgi:hypothetical protein
MTSIMVHEVTEVKMEPIEVLSSGTLSRKIRVNTKTGPFEIDLFLADTEPDDGLAIKI